MGADNIANGSAALEPDFSANTINTTWYSNGTQLTGNNIPATCTYDAALTPPTPEDRPGYVFAGWRLMPPACLIPSSLASTAVLSFGYKNDSTDEQGADSSNTSDYGLTEDFTWGVTWSNGDKVVGEAKCSALQGNSHSGQWGGDSADWTATESELTNASGDTKYCWCRATGYIASGAELCSFSSPSWVFATFYRSASNCAYSCAYSCAYRVQSNQNNSVFRAAVFIGILAQ